MRFHDGIHVQPQTLERSAEAVARALANVAPLSSGAVVALVGIGASEHVARSAAPCWREQGLRAFAVSASELLPGTSSVADVYVAMSESGRSVETVAAMKGVAGRRLGITNFADSPIAEVVDDLLLMDSGPDSPVYTTGYTATLQAVGMLGEHWGGRTGDWSRLPLLAEQVISDATPVMDSLAGRFDQARIIDVVAGGSSQASAGEGALLLREAARAHTAAYETYNYLHGPMEPMEAGTACIVIGNDREVRLARDMSDLGCQTLLITKRQDVPAGDTLTVVTLPDAPSAMAGAVLEILPVQLLGWSLASRRGLRVDGFRYEQDDIKLGSR